MEFVQLVGRPWMGLHKQPSPHDDFHAIFDNQDRQPPPILHFIASPYALLVQAGVALGPFRFRNARLDQACDDVLHLLDLYQRTPVQPQALPLAVVDRPNFVAFRPDFTDTNLFPSLAEANTRLGPTANASGEPGRADSSAGQQHAADLPLKSGHHVDGEGERRASAPASVTDPTDRTSTEDAEDVTEPAVTIEELARRPRFVRPRGEDAYTLATSEDVAAVYRHGHCGEPLPDIDSLPPGSME